jgi:uncharacterized protein Usg
MNSEIVFCYNYRLVTVDILYYLPEYENMLQQFIWQTNDRVPELTRVYRFLNYWNEYIEAETKEVRIFCTDSFAIPSFNHVKYEFPVFLN